ncbi:MAG: hypothetical protein OR994_07065, partial [Candidatus Poseidoniales archaeon]|nr:hypothetical protein [Candidatus Poseidoniales archaeon]
MRKMTPMILVALMLASIFASIDFVELEETVIIEEAGARSGADAEAIAITSPKETSCNTNGCRNELKVGEATTFAAFIKNSGDAAIDEMGYTVTVYSNDGSGNAGAIVLDAQGDQLSWTNGDVICDAGCPDTSLAAGAILGGGKTTLKTISGNDIQWTPVAGFYVVEVVVNAIGDVDPGNDVQQIIVNVVDWVDIAVDLSWDGQDSDLITGSGSKDFTLTVTSNGSAANGFNPRNVSVLLHIEGDLTQAQSTGVTPDDLWDNGGRTVLTAGTSGQIVETFRHGEDPNNVTNATRTVLGYQSVWTYQGSVMPNDDVDEGTYSLEASLRTYVDYDSFESCWETNSTGENNTTSETIFYHMCEEEQNSDDYPNSNADRIDGAVNNYHDIRITTLTVFQGYDSNGDGEPTFSVSDGQTGDLNVGMSRIHVQVEHRGSNEMTTYDWEITFTTTK